MLFAQVGDRAHSVMADIGLADACSMLGRFEEAEHLYERARQRADHHGLPVLSASAQDGQATLALSRGEHGRALAGLEAARRAWANLDLPHLRIEAEKGLADAYLEVRLLPEAIALYEDLVQTLREREAGATLPWTLAQLGRARALAGQPEQAWAALDDADAAFVAQDIGIGRATVAFARAELLLAQGHAAAARALAAEAVEAFEAGESTHDADWARWLQAAAAQACGGADDALQRCEALLAKPDLPPPLRVRAEVERAAAWRHLGHREAACLALERAIDDVELMQAALPGDELRRAFLADGTRAHAERLRFALETAEAGPTDAAAAQVLHWLERLKDRAVGERLGRGTRRPEAAASRAPDTTDESDALRSRLDAIYRREQRLTQDEDPPPQALIEEARRLERSLLERARRHRLYAHAVDPLTQTAQGNAVAGSPVEAPTALLARLQQGLSAQAALLVYGVLDDELFAVIVTRRVDPPGSSPGWVVAGAVSCARAAVPDRDDASRCRTPGRARVAAGGPQPGAPATAVPPRVAAAGGRPRWLPRDRGGAARRLALVCPSPPSTTAGRLWSTGTSSAWRPALAPRWPRPPSARRRRGRPGCSAIRPRLAHGGGRTWRRWPAAWAQAPVSPPIWQHCGGPPPTHPSCTWPATPASGPTARSTRPCTSARAA